MANRKIIELGTDKNRMIIAKHIKEKEALRAFLSGVKGEYYVISDLDLSEIKGYNFDDANNYMFRNSLIKDLDLHFGNERVYFDDCLFEGVVSLYNQGIGLTDMIDIQNTKSSSKLAFLSINSLNVVLENNEITATRDIAVIGDNCVFKKNMLRAPSIRTDYLNSCILEDSDIDHLVDDYGGFGIKENVYINGIHLSRTNPYINVDDSIKK